MKLAFLYVLLVVMNSNSPEFEGSIKNGEAPAFSTTIIFDTYYHCQQAQAEAAELASKRGDKLVINSCHDFSFPTAPEKAVRLWRSVPPPPLF